eukprot:1397677-Ditylum_brightwellii.AAC.1
MRNFKNLTAVIFCPFTAPHVGKSQLVRLLMACSTPVAPSYTGRILLHHWIKASQNREEFLITFLFSVWRESRIPLSKDLNV